MPWKVGKLVAYKAVSEFVSKVATFLTLLLGARYLSAEAFGILSLGFLSGWLLGVATDFGLQIYLTREVSHLREQGSPLFWSLFRWRLGAAGIGLGLLVVSSFWLDWPGENAAFLLVAAAQLQAAITEFICHYFRGLDRSDLEASLQLVVRPGAVAVLAVGMSLRPGLLTFGAILFALNGFGVAGALLLARRFHMSAPDGQTPDPAQAGFRESVQKIAPIGLGILLSGLYFRADLYLIEWWLGLEEVGLYNAVYRLLDALRLVPAAFLAVVFPLLCRATSLRLLTRSAALLLMIALVISLGAGWQAETVVRLTFGSRYLDAVPAFRVLLLALPLLYLNNLLTHQLIAWGRQASFATYCGLGLVVNLLLNLWFIPALGIIGAAWSTILTEAFLAAAWLVCIARSRNEQVATLRVEAGDVET